MPDTGYGSAKFLRACRISAACREIEGEGLRARWRRLRAGSLLLAWHRRRLPAVVIHPTASPAGRMIEEHFAIREEGRWRYRGAQAALSLPGEFSEYMRGRSRQAVRTNLAHARKAALRVESHVIPDWRPGQDDSRLAHIALGPDDLVAAEAILSVDEGVALLHGLTSNASYARWLLHTAIVERLCGSCDVLLVNSDEAYLLSAGNQHFQRLLGYGVARVRVARAPRGPVITVGAGEAATVRL